MTLSQYLPGYNTGATAPARGSNEINSVSLCGETYRVSTVQIERQKRKFTLLGQHLPFPITPNMSANVDEKAHAFILSQGAEALRKIIVAAETSAREGFIQWAWQETQRIRKNAPNLPTFFFDKAPFRFYTDLSLENVMRMITIAEQSCLHCNAPWKDHHEGKCLFDTTRYGLTKDAERIPAALAVMEHIEKAVYTEGQKLLDKHFEFQMLRRRF